MSDFELNYPGGPYIHRGLKEQELREFLGRLDINVRDVGTGWVWYRLPTFFDGELGIGIELGFSQGNLRELTLFHDDPVYGKSWNDWSEEKEQLRAETTRSWLQAKGFQTGNHSWGEVWSYYDAKSGFGSGGVRYAP
ncbi:hypothetical protein ACFSB1_12160 [Halopseudomonas phragmitis]|uniref:hypothetical protein n=1 Tax=Halopseudomonas phragmitis TaxID=1931241 RepID=UPI0012BA6159|nr:hypothetical protein [Halopseudomonas phragmitis]